MRIKIENASHRRAVSLQPAGMLKILFLGDVIGEPGRRAVVDSISRFKETRGVDFVIVNGENAADRKSVV